MSMRMRKKRNFDARMDACGDLLLARGAGGILNMKEAAEKYRALVDFSAVFGNDHPVELEIGCGKGGPNSDMPRSGSRIGIFSKFIKNF